MNVRSFVFVNLNFHFIISLSFVVVVFFHWLHFLIFATCLKLFQTSFTSSYGWHRYGVFILGCTGKWIHGVCCTSVTTTRQWRNYNHTLYVQHNKVYSMKEYYERLQIFTDNRRRIEKHNQGNHSYTSKISFSMHTCFYLVFYKNGLHLFFLLQWGWTSFQTWHLVNFESLSFCLNHR